MINSDIDTRLIKQPDNSLPSCIICDLDGTLALHTSGRKFYEESRCNEDSCDPRLALLLDWMMYYGLDIIFITGRQESCRDTTLTWIKTYLHNWRQQKIDSDERIKLFMRSRGDKRPDQVIKKEIYDEYIKDKFNVLCVFEDRDKVVEMWRDEGLLCNQVYYGDF